MNRATHFEQLRISNEPLSRIKWNLSVYYTWGMLVNIGFLLVLAFLPIWPLTLFSLMIMMFITWSIVSALVLLEKINTVIAGENDLEETERHYRIIQSWIKVQQKIWLFAYPVSILGGCIAGGMMGSGQHFTEIVEEPVMIVVSLISMIVLTVFCARWARALFYKSFGQFSEQLKDSRDLKRVNSSS